MRKALLIVSVIIAVLGAGLVARHYKRKYVNKEALWIEKNYRKRVEYIKMRDGIKLCTIIYEPTDAAEKHPILLERTPYSIAPYDATLPTFWANKKLMAMLKEHYILVYQNVRGKLMSEGEFEDVRPYNPDKKGNKTDEATDAYDTIDWLISHTANNNGCVGAMGISYAGFYAFMAALSGHPALKAVSPQAPVTDWYSGDDFHHNGAFMELDAFSFFSFFDQPLHHPSTETPKSLLSDSCDSYQFFLKTNTLSDLSKKMGDSISFWKQFYEHPDYDTFWQRRNIRNYAQYLPANVATLVTGGLFDAEDCFGTWELYKSIDEKKAANNHLAIGPWSHGSWAGGWNSSEGDFLGNVRFGSKTVSWYDQNIELPFFDYYLRGKGNNNDVKKTTVFFTGSNEWKFFDHWPAAATGKPLFLQTDKKLSFEQPARSDDSCYRTYISDPATPVPYTEGTHAHRTIEFMDDDQQFAVHRTDVLTYQTDTLTDDVMLGGPVIADLYTSISTTDADFVVKLIDVFPGNFTYDSVAYGNGRAKAMGGYQMLVRGEVMRGRYRYSLSKPQPFVPGEITEVKYSMPDVAHVFKKGHRIMVQVQSSWFPFVDRNPQQFVNIYTCTAKDFVPSAVKIFSGSKHASSVILPIINNAHQ